MASPPFLAEFARRFRCELAPLGAETAPGDDHDLSMMGQPIQAGGCQERIAKEIEPFRRSPVTGDQHAADFVAFIHDVIEVGGGGIDSRLQPKVVQDQERRA